MRNVVIFGGPGSGKGTQSQKIKDFFGLYHISTGEVLRDQIARGTELGKLADTYISQGHLIPDELMLQVLSDVLDSHPDEVAHGVIFDGFPRTIAQARALKDLLNERGTELHSVLGLEVDDDELVDRMLKRGSATGRADDNPETIKERLKVYHSKTQPLKDFYKGEGLYRPIDGKGDVDSVFDRVKERLL